MEGKKTSDAKSPEKELTQEEKQAQQMMIHQMQQQRIEAYKAELDRVDLLISWRKSISTKESNNLLPSIDAELSEVLLLLQKRNAIKKSPEDA